MAERHTVTFKPSNAYQDKYWDDPSYAIDSSTSTKATWYAASGKLMLWGTSKAPTELVNAVANGGKVISVKAYASCIAPYSVVGVRLTGRVRFGVKANGVDTGTTISEDGNNTWLSAKQTTAKTVVFTFNGVADYINNQKSLSNIAYRFNSGYTGDNKKSNGIYDFYWEFVYEDPPTSKIYVGGNAVSSVYVGTTPVKAVYLGTTKIL